MNNAIGQFREAMLNAGLAPPAIITPGMLHRFPSKGKTPRNKAGWCKLFDDLRGGVFGDYSSGFKGHWQADGWEKLSSKEQEAFYQRCETERKQRDIEQQQRYEASTVRAKEILTIATDETSTHPYAILKKVSLGSRIKRGTWLQRGWDDALLVPLYDKEQKLCTIEAINTDGKKDFLKDGQKKGCFHPFGKISGADRIFIGEGVATVAAVYDATNTPAVAAMDSGNLEAVALAMRELAPTATLILLADNDIKPDSPNIGIKAATKAAKVVSGIVAIPELNNEACDFWDLWDKQGKEAVLVLIDAAIKAQAQTSGMFEVEGSNNKNQASELVHFVQERAELFHDENQDVYAQDLATRETRRLDGRPFRDWLVATYYKAAKKSPREQSVREALNTLGGLARYQGECHEVSVRVAMHDGAYYLDLAEPGSNRAVCITDKGWEVVQDSAVRFLRPETLRPLPVPIAGGNISILWPLMNIPENVRLLVIAWLIESLRPDTPFPILELIGEQGSAKSTTQMMLRRLIDPNACDLRTGPKKKEDIFIGAAINWVVSYENISYLSGEVQDALCIIATGGGYAKRKLYTDADESVINAKRPIVLNGISAAVTAQDLIDRTISIEVPVIEERLEVTALWATFQTEYPKLLGALLTIFSKALAILPETELPKANRPRLTEFARLGMAIATVMGQNGHDFLEQFKANRQEAIARTIDASPVASALIDWFIEDRQKLKTIMSVKQLLATITNKKPSHADNWPHSPKGFGDILRRVAPALRQMGIECRNLGKYGGVYSWEIKSCEI